MALTKTDISELYVSIFNRASEKSGSQNWLNSGYNTDATAMANAMLADDAAKEYFGASLLTDAAFVEHIYANTLNKGGADVDAAGKAGWVEFLATGASRGEMVAKMIEAIKEYKVGGAKYATADQTTKDAAQQFANRVEVSDYTADTLETIAVSEINSTLSFSSALTVTKDAATITTAKATIDANNPANVGKTFTLTTGVDTFTGTDKADLFKAALLTVNDGDTLDGGAGVDTLNAEINAAVTDKFKSSNIEKVNVTSYGAQSVDMKNITGVETITTKGSTGTLTLNNIATSTVGFGFEGSSTNDINTSHVAGALAGTNDILNVNLNGAKDVKLTVAAGFESAKITTAGSSSIDTLTAPGVATYTVEGTGSVDFKDNLANVTTLSATNNSGAITATVDATTGYATKEIQAGTDGASVLLGAGNDNIGFKATTAKTSTVKLGAGDDKLLLKAGGAAGATYVFAEAGNDTIKIDSTSGVLTVSDLIDGGEGTDTLVIDNNAAAAATTNTMVLRGIEKLTLTNNATGANVINSADSAIAVTVEAGNAATAMTAFSLTGLTSGSTVTVNDAKDATAGVKDLTVGYKDLETAATIDVNSVKADGAVTITNVTAATIDYAKSATSSTGGITAAKTKSLTITGADAVTTGAINAAIIETVSATAAKALDVGNISSTANKLTTVNLTSTTDDVTALVIGSTTNTETLNVTINAAKDISQTGAINSTKVGNISATSTAGKVTLGTIGANATTMGDVTVNAKGDATISGAIGNATLKTLGTVSMTSTDGSVALKTVDANDSTGITVNLSGKTIISDVAGLGTAAVVKNTDGNITASVAGAAAANVNYKAGTAAIVGTAATKGVVNLTATNTGGLETDITNAGTIADALTSTITLGNAVTNKSNKVDVAGTVATLNVTGGTGLDEITLTGAQVKSGTIALGTTLDKADLDYVNFDGIISAVNTAVAPVATTGVVINLGSKEHKIDEGKDYQTIVAAGHAVEYNAAAGATAKKLVTDGFDLTLSGVEKVKGTAFADIIIANAEGSTIIGGAGADLIVAGAGKDNITFTSNTDTADATYGSTSTSTVGMDIITGLATGDKLDFSAVIGATLADEFDAMVALQTSGNIVATNVVAGTDGNSDGKMVQIKGIYDATANQFTVDNTASANALMINYASDGGANADQAVILVGLTTAVTSITDGVITI